MYGLRTWPPRSTAAVLVAVCVVTAAALWHLSVVGGYVDVEELAEVPLMAMLFLAMVWHARRRQAALERVRQLAQSERALRDRERLFSRRAAHQLRSPITVARGHAQLILEDCTEPGVIEDVGTVIDELDKLNAVTTKLLALGTLETPETLDPVPCDLDELVASTVDRWRGVADRDWRALTPCGPLVQVDRERIQAALDELIDNALKHTVLGGVIEVGVRYGGQTVEVAVRDDGVGIDAPELPRVFDHFWRGSGSRRYHGSGLGLAIVKVVAEVHGGRVVMRANPDGGVSVAILLPLAPERRAVPVAAAPGAEHYSG